MFLLVPAHPGFPGQIPQSRKMVVFCVCVCKNQSAFNDVIWKSIVAPHLIDSELPMAKFVVNEMCK